MAYDPLDPYDVAADEIAQRRETGYDVQQAEVLLAAVDPEDEPALRDLYRFACSVTRSRPWPYQEPDELAAIVAALPPAPAQPTTSLTNSEIADRILGGWLGRVAGCNLGKPVEDGDHWTAKHLKNYLQRAGAYPLRDYVPLLEPMPEGFLLRENWPNTTRGHVDGSDRDDDIDYSILALHLLERHGSRLAPAHVAEAWLTLLPILQVFTAERAAYRNLTAGVPLEEVARTRNPYREWIGAQIRADVFGWVHPGRPRDAALLAYQDACLSHVGNGIYGEMWAAALIAGAFVAADARSAVSASLAHIPPRSRLSESVRYVLELHAEGVTWEGALHQVQDRYGHYAWVHTVNNAAAVVAGLLWGDGDYTRTVGLTVQAGWDTDSNGATAGSVVGVMRGAASLPGHFIEPLHDRTRSALFGFDHSRISELAARTTQLAVHGLS